MGMKILVLGGTQFIGAAVVRQLSAVGHRVWMYHRGETPFPGEGYAGEGLPANVKHIYADFSMLQTYKAVLRQMQFDAVVHMMAMSGSDARTAVEIFAGHTSRLVVASSQDVYACFGALIKKQEAEIGGHAVNEDGPLRTTRYIQGGTYEKLDVEEAVLEGSDKLPFTILRLSAVYGPGDPRQRFYAQVRRMEDGRKAVLFEPAAGNFKWTHAYVENAARAFVLALEKPEAMNRIYNVGEQHTPTQAERTHEIGRAAGWRGQVLVLPQDGSVEIPGHLIRNVDYRHDVEVDSGLIRRELGYTEIVPAAEGWKETVAWQRTVCPMTVDPRQFDYGSEDAVLAALGVG